MARYKGEYRIYFPTNELMWEFQAHIPYGYSCDDEENTITIEGKDWPLNETVELAESYNGELLV